MCSITRPVLCKMQHKKIDDTYLYHREKLDFSRACLIVLSPFRHLEATEVVCIDRNQRVMGGTLFVSKVLRHLGSSEILHVRAI